MSATYPMDMVRGRITIQEAGNAQYRGLLHATGCIIRCARRPAVCRRRTPSSCLVPRPPLNLPHQKRVQQHHTQRRRAARWRDQLPLGPSLRC